MVDKATSADVAARAGVSRSAVSRVFTDGASASPETVEKVKRAAAELGYRPNALARSLLTGRSRIIGLVVAYLDNQFYPQAVQALSVALQEQGYHVLIFMAGNSSDNVEDVTRGILDYQVDGLILASVALSSDLAQHCKAMGVPVVLFNRRQGAPDDCAVVSNNFQGGQMAARHLVSRGAKRVGYIAGWEGASTQRDREAGFMTGLREAGLGLYAREVGDFDETVAKEAARQMFRTKDRPDAVFVCNDHMALAVMDVLRFELGLKVPNDVALVGFDNVPASAWPAYDMTTVAQDTDAMIAATVDRILGMIGTKQMQGSVEVAVNLIVRSSA